MTITSQLVANEAQTHETEKPMVAGSGITRDMLGGLY